MALERDDIDVTDVSMEDMQSRLDSQVIGKSIASIAASGEQVCITMFDGTRMLIIGLITGVGIMALKDNEPTVLQ